MLSMFWFRMVAWPTAVGGWCLVFLTWYSAIFESSGDPSYLRALAWIVASTMLLGALCVSYGLARQERAYANAAGENVAESQQTR